MQFVIIEGENLPEVKTTSRTGKTSKYLPEGCIEACNSLKVGQGFVIPCLQDVKPSTFRTNLAWYVKREFDKKREFTFNLTADESGVLVKLTKIIVAEQTPEVPVVPIVPETPVIPDNPNVEVPEAPKVEIEE